MNRTEWKALHQKARANYRARPSLSFPLMVSFEHGGTPWSLSIDQGAYGPKAVTVLQRIIVDRPLRQRVAYDLAWSRRYRLDARRNAYPAQCYAGARACAMEARAALAASSAFQALP